MKAVLSQAEMVVADRYAIQQLKIPTSTLMEHAALALAQTIAQRFSPLKDYSGVIVAGPGNNGGDVLAAARLLRDRGAVFEVVLLDSGGDKLSEACQAQRETLERLGVVIRQSLPATFSFAWALDGIFGVGLSRGPKGVFEKAIAWLNSRPSPSFVLSADIPSGLNADTGQPVGECVRADETVTFGFLKRGLLTGKAADYTGKVWLAEIGIPRQIPNLLCTVGLIETADVVAGLPTRNPTSHKGNFGHVVIVSGSEAQLGASVLAAVGALHTGAGLVSVAGTKAAQATLRALVPSEVMLEEVATLFSSQKPRTVVLGPGLGQGEDAKAILKQALASCHSLVLDADALNLLATGPLPIQREAITVLTPHPKEASRLLGVDVAEVEANRYEAIQRLIQKTGAVCLLKGRGTLVRAPGAPHTYVIDEGTPALAKGGSGDLLSGCIAAFLSQGVSPQKALAFGAFVHGRAAQYLADRGEEARALTPSLVAKALPAVLKELSHG